MEELPGGLRRVTMPLPSRPGHVHCYLLPVDDGFMLVDTGLGLPDAAELWAAELAQLPGPVSTIFVTHFHPDHLGATADVRELTGARVVQGRLDAEQSAMTWKNEEWSIHLAGWFRRNGVPDEVTEELLEQGELFRPFIRPVLDPELVDDGDRLHGWEIVAAPGHADGQLTLLKDGVLIAADHLLARITPTVGLWPASRPDPLGDYLGSLQRTIDLAPTIAYGGHGDTVTDPVGRANELIAHHAERLLVTAAAIGSGAADGVRGVVPAVRRRPAARRRAGSPSPRRSPTSSGSSGTAGPSGTSCSRTETSPASPILPRSSGRTSLQYRGPGDRGMTVVPRASRRCRSDPPERLLRRGRVLARHRAPDPAQGADRRGESPGARRDEDHERSAALHRGDAARRHAHLARHRRHRREGALRPVRDLPRNLRGRRARVPRSSRSCTSSSASSSPRASRSATRSGSRSASPFPCGPSSSSLHR